MAQTGYTPILIYSSSTTSNAPTAGSLTNSTLGSELAINITDGKLFYKDNANAVQVIAWKITPTTAGGTGLTSYTAGDLLYYATGTTLTKLAIGTAYQMLAVNSGATAPSWQASATSTLTAQGDLLYASAANTLARLAKNTSATRYLSNTGTSNNPAWAQVDLTNGVTGTLPTGNGGTGLTSFTANGIVYASSTSALATGSVITFDGTNFGIGTSAPTTKLTISNNTVLPSAGAIAGTNLWQVGADSATNIMLLDAFGSTGSTIGIIGRRSFGTAASPSATGSGAALLNIQGFGYGTTGYSSTARVQIQLGTDSGAWTDTSNHTRITFSTTPSSSTTMTERMRLHSSGGLSLGNTTDPGTGNLSVTGTIAATGQISGTKNSAAQAVFSGWNSVGGAVTANGQVQVGLNAADSFVLGYDDSGNTTCYIDSTYNSNSSAIKIRTKTASTAKDCLTFTGDGAAEFGLTVKTPTTISVGAATPAASGAGITFPATQSASSDANTLDDYEEGTWTPADASGASLTFTSVTANYTKIGNVVYINATLTYPTTADTSQAKISGLPFAPAVCANLLFVSPATNTVGAGQGWVAASSTTMTLVTQQNASKTNANLSTLTLYFSGFYFV